MPIRIEHRGSKWVVTDPEGHIYGKHSTKMAAEKQRAAINANKHRSK